MYIIGRGRYAREAYPQSPAAGGGSSIPPLKRQRFIDGDTTSTGLNGSASDPFKTIAQFMTARGPSSVADASSNFVGWLMPALTGYAEAVFFPAYASTELRGDSFSGLPGTGTVITGNVTWNNVAGAFVASPAALVTMHNVSVFGDVTVTDDVGAPFSAFLFGGDELSEGSAGITGNLDTSTTTKLSAVSVYNASVSGNINLGVTATSPNLNLVSSNVTGTIAAKSMGAIDSDIGSSAITIDPSGTANFFDSRFNGAAPALTCTGGATFDGPSWLSFLEAQGTRSAGTIVLVVGGYNGGGVEGANLPTGAGPTNVSLNGTGASVGFTGENSGNHYSAVGLLADSTVKILIGGGEKEGDTMLISKPDLAAFSLTVQDNNGVTVGVIPTGNRGFVLAQFKGGSWVFAEGGALAA